MKKITCFIVVLCLFTNLQAQTILKFSVKTTRIRFGNAGSWSEWKEFGDMDKVMKQGVVLDLDKRSIILFDQSTLDKEGVKKHPYTILSLEQDTLHKDDGFWSLKIPAINEENRATVTFEFLFKATGSCQGYTIIFGDDKFQSKLEADLLR